MRLPITVAAALLLSACVSPPRAGDEGLVDLFDGRTLDGWVQRGGAAAYRVEEGAIVGATRPNQPNSFLCTRESFADFILELEFKVDDGLNSGVQVRSLSDPAYHNGRVHGYQIEIDPSDRAWTGGIYDEARRGWLADLALDPTARAAFRPGAWNLMRVEARADRIQTWINRVPCADLTDGLTRQGFIALQVHGVGARDEELSVRWRNIRLRRL